MIAIGKVLKPQGIRGELKILALTDDTSRFSGLKNFFIENKTYTVTSVRIGGNFVYIKTLEINDMNSAELLRNKMISVEDDDKIKLPKGRYFIKDLVGLKLITLSGEVLGVIEDIGVYGAADVIIVKGEKNFMFPYLNNVVKSVDLKAGTMIVDKTEFSKVSVYED